MADFSGRSVAAGVPLSGTPAPSNAASYSSSGAFGSFPSAVSARDMLTGTTPVNYCMRGYYAAGATFEYFTVQSAPSTTVPSGHVLADLSIVSVNY